MKDSLLGGMKSGSSANVCKLLMYLFRRGDTLDVFVTKVLHTGWKPDIDHQK